MSLSDSKAKFSGLGETVKPALISCPWLLYSASMKVDIKLFTRGLFVLLGVFFIALWSLSLYFVFERVGANTDSGNGFWMFWWEQAMWVLPVLASLLVLAYISTFKSFVWPLLRLSRKMRHVVVARHSGKHENHDELGPGLSLLDRYFRRLTHLATHDPLTGLNTRVIFEERLKQAIVEGKRSGRKYALVFIDIDDFHKVNNEYGHYLADGLLKQMANRLSKGLRESDTVARLEKDDFALLLEFSDREQISNLLGKIYRYLTRRYDVYGRKVKISISVGVAVYPEHGQDIDELSVKADRAMMEAQKGDSPLVFARHNNGKSDYLGYSMVQSLRRALDNNEFRLVFQPVLEVKSNVTSYFEALLRWKNAEEHSFSIQQMIQMAENNQLIKPVTNWIVDNACKSLSLLKHPGVRIAVNLSMIDLHDQELPDRIKASLDRWQVRANELQVEITEGQIMQEPEQVIEILRRLTEMGISLAIDDFGTGQASLTYLRRLPVEKLKIDQSFVKDMVTNAEDRAIVEATIQLAHTLDIEVTAEGVESAAILEMLSSMSCDYVQGYYISRPIDQDQILIWCNDQTRRNAS